MNRSEALHYLRQDRTRILDQAAIDRDDQLAEALYLLDPYFESSLWQGRTVRMFLAHLPDITISYHLSRSSDQSFVIHTAEQAAIQFNNTGVEHQPLLVRVGLRHSIVIAHTVVDTRTSNGVKTIKRGIDATLIRFMPLLEQPFRNFQSEAVMLGKLALETGVRLQVRVMERHAGFYNGTSGEEGPYSREFAECWTTLDAAERCAGLQ